MVLPKFPWPRGDAVAALSSAVPAGSRLRVFRAVTVVDGSARDVDEGYAYVSVTGGGVVDVPALERLRRALPALAAARLQPLLQLAGAAHGEDAPYHYIVETHVLAESEAD